MLPMSTDQRMRHLWNWGILYKKKITTRSKLQTLNLANKYISNWRTLTGGLMKTSEGQLLPLLEGEDGKIEFMAGDVRARENPGLSSLHTIFVREHNRIATLIAANIPQWSDECIYQFTRRNENHNVGKWFLFESCEFFVFSDVEPLWTKYFTW